MPASDVDTLCQTLLRLKLVPSFQLEEARGQLGRGETSAALLDWLERQGALSSFQLGKLRKGDLDGLVLGNYKLLYRNASGSFARVYRACDINNGGTVGLKVLRQRWANDPQMVRDFHREADLGQSLQHENIVPIYEVGQSGDQHYLTMEFVEGGNLRDFINIRKKLSPKEATRCVLDMTQGLHYAAARGALHRDLKMTNVLMSSQGVAKLVDFGLSGGPTASGGDEVQRALDYATLERGTNVPRNDPRSDLYFVGAIYYELLTGIAPLGRTRDRHERGQFSRYQQVRPLRQTDPNLPRAVVVAVERLMQLNAALRCQNTGEALQELQGALAEIEGGLGGSSAEIDTVAAHKPGTANQPTILCIEGREKQQDLLRKYFTKHGYRVLMLGDLQRGLARLKQSSVDCLLIMAESVGESVVEGWQALAALPGAGPRVQMTVLSEKQAAWKKRAPESLRQQVLVQPVTLRDLRNVIDRELAAR